MRVAACVLAIAGMVMGILTATLQGHTPNYEYLTIVFSVLGAVGGILVFFMPRTAMWILFLVAVLGVIPDSILWEGAGSFFLVSGLLDLSIIRRAKEA